MSGIRLRDWRPTDAPATETLWQRVFGSPRGGQTIAWLFRPGPAGPALRVVAEVGGAVVAHAGVCALRFHLDGEEVRGGYSVGAMTDPAMQGQGLYVQLARYLYRRMEEEGYAFVAGFSNRNSHRLMTGPLGRIALRPFPWCMRPVRPIPARWLGVRRREPLAPCTVGGVPLAPVEPGDPRLDALWARVAPTVRVGAVRDAAFAGWRFGTRPDAGYEIWLAGRGARPSAALVLRVLPVRGLRVGFLVELIVDPEALQEGRALLRLAARRTRAAGGVALSALLPRAGPMRRTLRRAGFVRVPEALHPQLIRFSVRGLGRFADHPALADPAAWLLSWADTDVV